jgi:lipoate---protein ligase
VGAVPAAGLVSRPGDLLDYDRLRRSGATMTRASVATPTIVLGAAQGDGVIDEAAARGWARARRRGGGGVVLLRPGDLWVDWWIPAADPRHDADPRAAAARAGGWWARALAPRVGAEVSVADGPHRPGPGRGVACFAGVGPGEVLVAGRKAVGVTQWRTREGTLLSTLAPASAMSDLVALLASPPEGLRAALDHATLPELGVADLSALVDDLAGEGPWARADLALG